MGIVGVAGVTGGMKGALLEEQGLGVARSACSRETIEESVHLGH